MEKIPEKTSQNSELILYRTEDGKTRLDVRFEGDTAWLSQSQMAELFLSKNRKDLKDSGLRFSQVNKTHFACPKCGAKVRGQIL
jgi:hypothetical protein